MPERGGGGGAAAGKPPDCTGCSAKVEMEVEGGQDLGTEDLVRFIYLDLFS